jgi:hypothetical protein
MSFLPLLNASKSGKTTAGNLGSMMDYLTNPWLGVLTGGYDPLAGVQGQAASRPLFDQIANDPNAPEAIGSIARSIADGEPMYKVNRMIEELPDTGGYTRDELRSLANDLSSENASYQKSLTTKTDMFTKAGLPALTERQARVGSFVCRYS